MKKILIILTIAMATVVSCSKDEPRNQGYTSFMFIHNEENLTLPNCVAGYYADGLCHKIADLGDMTCGQYTPEIVLTDESITEIRLFTTYRSPRVFRRSFFIKKNTKNIFELVEGDGATAIDHNDPTQWPF